ncbi:hypothetical protein [Bradyrhizobium liaoningense]|uniref:hypothetical protein n=1 Tax=Bradyrhizobium liaoningense TaxID=43992 RepID=UPI0004B0755B|nr:hypothetical protein [Bradyrhizobium liaoningense]
MSAFWLAFGLLLLILPIIGMIWPPPKRKPSRAEAVVSELVEDYILMPLGYVLAALIFGGLLYWWLSSLTPLAVLIMLALWIGYQQGRSEQR